MPADFTTDLAANAMPAWFGTHSQQCNVTHRKPGWDVLPGSNPNHITWFKSYFFTLIILYREA